MSGATPVINLPGQPGGQLYVNESGLPQGTQPGQTPTLSRWSFTIGADDGVDDLFVGGYQAIRDGVFTAGGVDFSYGRLSVTAFDASSGTVSVAFQLTGPYHSHPGAQMKYGDIFSFDVALSDRDGDSTHSSLVLQIRDDEAVQPQSDALTVVAGAAESGNLVTEGSPDRFTADGFGQVSRLADARWATMDFSADTDGRYSVAGQYGVLTVSPTGAYTYTAKADAAAGSVDRFDYWVTDGDGDEARASVTVTIEAGTAPPSTSGQVYTSPGPGSTVTAGAGDDTLNASQGADVLTGGPGQDSFAFQALPWSAGHITDFVVGADRLDLSGIFQTAGYTGSDPVADGRMRFDPDGAGGTRVYFDPDQPDGGEWPFHITTLDGVAPAGLTWEILSAGSRTPDDDGGASSGGDGGELIVSPGPGSTLKGGPGDDTLSASQGADILTGAGGDDTFLFEKPPWSHGEITDFTPGADVLDLSRLSPAYGGSDPMADGRLEFRADPDGTAVYVDIDGAGGEWPFYITLLRGVTPGQITAADWVF